MANMYTCVLGGLELNRVATIVKYRNTISITPPFLLISDIVYGELTCVTRNIHPEISIVAYSKVQYYWTSSTVALERIWV